MSSLIPWALKDKFSFALFTSRFSVFPWCSEKRPQIIMLWVKWFERLKWCATGLYASLLYLCSRKRSASQADFLHSVQIMH